MKRVLVDGTYLALQMKGVGRYTLNTLRQLSLIPASALDTDLHYQVLVRDGAPLPALPHSDSFTYHPIRVLDHYQHGFFTLPQYTIQLDADIVWVPYETSLGSFQVPYTVVCHDIPQLISTSQRAGGERPSPLRAIVQRTDQSFINRSLKRAATVFANSHFVENWLRTDLHIAPDTIRFAPCAPGADFSFLSQLANVQEVRDEINSPDGYILVLCTGDRRENLNAVLSVFDALTAVTNLNLVIAGTRDKERQEIQKQLQPFAWRERVHILPFYGENETQALANVYTAASVYLDLSLHEGFGMQVIEAMACGTPVVCSNRGALPEVAGNAASLVNPENTSEIVSAVQILLDDSALRHRRIESGYAQAAFYNWADTARTIAETFVRETREPY